MRRPPRCSGVRKRRHVACWSVTAGSTAGGARRWEKGTVPPATTTRILRTFSGSLVALPARLPALTH
jgi:hypothetical protein